jgi:DNA-binding HxlR family transcriptional regulator
MKENFDKKKMLETLTDPDVSIILEELEDGEKDLAHLTEKLQLSNDDIIKRLSYLIEHQFVKVTNGKKKTTFSVDKNKLDEIMEMDENFTGVVNGLAELDQYLN